MNDTDTRPVQPYFVEVTITQSYNFIVEAQVSDQAEAIVKTYVQPDNGHRGPLTEREAELYAAFIAKYEAEGKWWTDVARQSGVRVQVHSAGVIGGRDAS